LFKYNFVTSAEILNKMILDLDLIKKLKEVKLWAEIVTAETAGVGG